MGMQRTLWRGFGGAGPAGTAENDAMLDALLDASDVNELVRINEARTAGLEDVDFFTDLQSKLPAYIPRDALPAIAIGGLALGVLLLIPSGSRR